MDEKQRRISRVLTIDEIINPPGMLRGHASTAINQTTTIHVASPEMDPVNPNILRLNRSQVIYTPGMTNVIENEPRMSGAGGGRGIKNVSFASNTTASMPSVRVYREQYWNWSCGCKNWTKRERMLLLVVAVFGCIILGLVSFISVYARDHKFGPPLSDTWLGWTL